MSTCSTFNRITSKDIVVEWLPCGKVQAHIQHLRFYSTVSAGTFKLWVNGHVTAAITYSSTTATLLTSINSALDALPNLANGDIVATGTDNTNITLTSITSKFFVIKVVDDALTGNTTSNPNVTTDVSQQGSEVIRLSAELSSFGYEVQTDTVDMTSISEYEGKTQAVKETMSFDLMMYDAQQDWLYAVQAGYTGLITVYKTGKVANGKNTYFSFNALLENVGKDFPDHEKVEMNISGSRVGAMVVPFDTIYTV